MKSIQRRFQQITGENPNWSSYLCFAEAIRNCQFKKPAIRKWFKCLVDKEDYEKADKIAIIRQLYELSQEEGEPYILHVNRLKNTKIASSQYQIWRGAVVKRDGKKCRICGKRFPLVAHHIRPFINHPKLRIEVKNGLTLCHECHHYIHKYRIEENLWRYIKNHPDFLEDKTLLVEKQRLRDSKLKLMIEEIKKRRGESQKTKSQKGAHFRG